MSQLLETNSIRPGLPVHSLAGDLLGHVLQVQPGGIFLARKDNRPIWISDSAVFTIDDFSIVLICDAGGVARYAMGGADAP